MVEQFNSTKVCLSAHALCAFPLVSLHTLRKYFSFFFFFLFGNNLCATPKHTHSYEPLAEFVQRNTYAKLSLSLFRGLPWGTLPHIL